MFLFICQLIKSSFGMRTSFRIINKAKWRLEKSGIFYFYHIWIAFVILIWKEKKKPKDSSNLAIVNIQTKDSLFITNDLEKTAKTNPEEIYLLLINPLVLPCNLGKSTMYYELQCPQLLNRINCALLFGLFSLHLIICMMCLA